MMFMILMKKMLVALEIQENVHEHEKYESNSLPEIQVLFKIINLSNRRLQRSRSNKNHNELEKNQSERNSGNKAYFEIANLYGHEYIMILFSIIIQTIRI
jgi:thymidylate kinase